MEPLMPFNYVIITPEDTSMSEGCMSASLPRSIATSPSDRHFPELLELPPKHCPGNQACYKIGNRHTYPDSQLSVELWKNQQTRYQDKNLAGDRQKYRLARHADTLEKVGRHHLETDDREAEHHHSDSLDAQVYQLLIGSKHSWQKCVPVLRVS